MLWVVFGVLAGMFVLGIYLNMKSYDFDVLGALLAVIVGVVLVFALIVLPANYYTEVSNIEVYRATKATVEASREGDTSGLERAALTQKIIDANTWLAKVQYWNQTMFDPYIPNEVMDLEPIR